MGYTSHDMERSTKPVYPPYLGCHSSLEGAHTRTEPLWQHHPPCLATAPAPGADTCCICCAGLSISDTVIQLFSPDKVIKVNLIKMTHGLECVLQTLILFTVLGEWAIITKAGTECF